MIKAYMYVPPAVKYSLTANNKSIETAVLA